MKKMKKEGIRPPYIISPTKNRNSSHGTTPPSPTRVDRSFPHTNRSPLLNGYVLFHPAGPNFTLSTTREWYLRWSSKKSTQKRRPIDTSKAKRGETCILCQRPHFPKCHHQRNRTHVWHSRGGLEEARK